MKNKIFVFTIAIVMMLCFYPTNHDTSAFADTIDTYYRIINDNVYLYKQNTLEDSFDNIYFKLPQSYFVKLVSQQDNILYVEYDGIMGYVSTTGLQQCYSVPTMPYASNLTLETIDACNVVIYDAPTSTSKYIGLIPFNATNVKYYGTVVGQEIMSDQGSTWYFVKYQSFEQGVLYGYIYAPLTVNISEAPTNIEEVDTTKNDVQQTSITPVSAEFQNTDTVLIVVGLTILGFVLLSLIIRPDKRKKSPKHAKQNIEQNQIKKLDYNAKYTENDEFDF